MSSRWYNVAVAVLWLATMGWLLKAKILPPLMVGEPPSYRTILQADDDLAAPVSWNIELNGQPLGWATSRIRQHADGIGEIHSRVHLSRLPLAELTPAWMSSFVKLLEGDRGETETIIAMESINVVEIDPLGRLIGFRSQTLLGPAPATADAPQSSGLLMNISIRGVMDGDQLSIVVKSGEFEYATKVTVPPDALMGDALSPQTRLPNLRVGQTWTVPVYSPFRPPTSPLDILHATVERSDPIVWSDRVVPALLVVYRDDPGSGLTSKQAARGQVWVDRSGTVLKQEVSLLTSKLTFVRRSADEAIDPQTLPDGDAVKWRSRFSKENSRKFHRRNRGTSMRKSL